MLRMEIVMARKDLDNMTIEEKREYRRNRRIRSQILAYIFLVLIVACIGVGGFYGVRLLAGKVRGIVSQGNDVPTASQDSVSQDQFVMSSVSAGVIATPDDSIQDTDVVPQKTECEAARKYISEMRLEDKVAAMFIVSPEDITEVDRVTTAGDKMKEAAEKYCVGGMVFSDNNITGDDQIKEMLGTTQDYFKTKYNNTIWLIYSGDKDGGYKDAGVNVTMTAADSFALGSSGVLDCVTLFPFQNGGDAETVDESIDDMKELRFDAFTGAFTSGADAMMLSNVRAAAATGEDVPISLSYAMITEVIRGELEFDGVIITGPLDAKAITDNYSAGEAAIKAVNAGADMLLCSDDFFAAYEEVLTAVQSGEIPESRIDESLMRIYTAKYE